MRNSISHSKNHFEGIRLHNRTNLLRLRPKKVKCTGEITLLATQATVEGSLFVPLISVARGHSRE